MEPALRAASNGGQAAGFVVTPDPESANPRVSDVDGLKAVDDTLGHAAGDVLIAAIGRRFGAWAAARAGSPRGWEATNSPRPCCCRRPRVPALRDQLTQPVACETEILSPAVSIGAARAADLPDTVGASRMLRGADMAMYRVKTGLEWCGYVTSRHDAYVPAVHGRRPGRPGTHLPLG